jgi:hypothetical protein
VGEEDVVTFTDGVDANVELGVGWMGEERFDDEGVEGSSYAFNLIVVTLNYHSSFYCNFINPPFGVFLRVRRSIAWLRAMSC